MTAEIHPSTILVKLENLAKSVERVEKLIENEINDLKNEQIAELRRDNERLADDQRRAWEAIRSLENDRNLAHGGGKVFTGIITAVISIISSSAAAVFITKLLR